MALEAAVFDLDGVLTLTARLHAAAWKALFDDFLRRHAVRSGTPFLPFDVSEDYRAYVDGRPRRDGVRTFVASRGIALPEGSPDDPSGADTVYGLAKLKDQWFLEAVDRFGVDVDEAALFLVRALRARGVAVGVASSSRNCVPILSRAGIVHLFDAIVDGVDIARLGLAGKPAPDMFVECLHRLGVEEPARAVVFEDAAAGVAAARAGAFGLVIGVDRGGNRERLLANGADWVVSDFSDVTLDRMEKRLRAARFARRELDTAPPAKSPSPSPRAPGREGSCRPPR